MIRGYSDHAANERIFLAWVRTGIAVIAFGFVIEKFNIFLATIAHSALNDTVPRSQLEGVSGLFGRMGAWRHHGGDARIVLATARFVRTTRLLN